MTKHLLALSAAVALMGAPAAFAQTAPAAAAPPPATAADRSSPGVDDAASTAPAAPSLNSTTSSAPSMGAVPSTAAKVTAGLTVKDKTGAAIGTISEVNAGPNGAELATVKMGAQTFSVATSSLGLSDGAVTINATRAEVDAMIKSAGS